MNESKDRGFVKYRTPLLLLLGLNLLLGCLKLGFGFWADSPAMRSDGWNNSADFLYTILLGIGLWISAKPPDESHQEGHERIESFVGLGVASIILATGGFAIYDAVESLWSSTHPELGRWGLGLLGVSMVLKGGIAYYLKGTAERLNSPVLGTIGRDQVGDVLVDGSVIVSVFAVFTGWLWVDPLVAGGIGLMILKLGWDPFIENMHYLTGRSPDPQLEERLRRVTENIRHFSQPYQIRAHFVGPTLHVSLNVKADPEIPLGEIHASEETLRKRLLEEDNISRVFIHVEPPGEHSPN